MIMSMLHKTISISGLIMIGILYSFIPLNLPSPIVLKSHAKEFQYSPIRLHISFTDFIISSEIMSL